MKRILLAVSALLLLAVAALAILIVQARRSDDMAFLNEPRYELGEHRGAEFCGTCHAQIFAQWRDRSRHAIATTADSVLHVQSELKRHRILNYILGGEQMCYACHGPADDGVDCETCHGVAAADIPIMEVHQQKFTPARTEMQRADFCAACHEIPGFVTPYGDWQQSEAAANNVTCQGCHMERRDAGEPYHGFDSFVLNERAYEGDISIAVRRFAFPVLDVTVSNNIKGHSVPAGGPTRILALEAAFKDSEGNVIHRDLETFAKYHSLVPLLGFWPYKIISDSQLKSGEQRSVHFTLPSELEGRVTSVELSLRFYEVHDEDAGDIDRAYFVSEPFLQDVIVF